MSTYICNVLLIYYVESLISDGGEGQHFHMLVDEFFGLSLFLVPSLEELNTDMHPYPQ